MAGRPDLATGKAAQSGDGRAASFRYCIDCRVWQRLVVGRQAETARSGGLAVSKELMKRLACLVARASTNNALISNEEIGSESPFDVFFQRLPGFLFMRQIVLQAHIIRALMAGVLARNNSVQNK